VQTPLTGPSHGKIWIVVLFDYEKVVSSAEAPAALAL
jgi:hypothetical protein